MDFRFLGGSLGCAVGEHDHRRPPTTSAAPADPAAAGHGLGRGPDAGGRAVADADGQDHPGARGSSTRPGILTISLITDPTYGGVAASFATLADVIIAEPGARLGFAGPRVIEQTIGQNLPAGFQTAEFLLRARPGGRRHAAGGSCGRRWPAARRLRRPAPAAAAPARSRLPGARCRGHPGRGAAAGAGPLGVRARWPGTLGPPDHAGLRRADCSTDFEELHGDRIGEDCPAMVGGHRPARPGCR